jgi:hypothetical protein
VLQAKADEKAMDAAKSVGVTAPDSLNAEQKADNEKKLSKISGPQFDRDFAEGRRIQESFKKRRCGWGVREREYPGSPEAP